jgi:hypothetical protein
MPATIQKQVQLPLRRAVEIAWRSLRVRLARSLLTLLTIIMAIAFLANVWTTRALESQIASAGGGGAAGPTGGVARTVWLLSLSLLVCLVGISNAMLMSVMERFREIGTMKCLGALDSFILKLFLLESLFLGAAGSALGVLVGESLTLLLLASRLHAANLSIPWPTIAAISAASIAIGLLITAAAAMYPARKAAQMDPIAAMRVEV